MRSSHPWRRRVLQAFCLTLASAALPFAAQAQANYPDRPLRIIVPFTAGGSSDIQGRLLAKYLGQLYNQPVVVENRPGVGGTLGPATMSRTAKPDGYTVALYTLAMLRMPYMQKTSWDPINDFTFILGLSGYTFGFTVRADSPYKTFNEYIEAARKNPGSVDYGSTGVGSSPHLLIEEVAINAKVKLNHVPYKGNADMQQALLGGHVMAQSDATGWDQFVDSGKMRLLVTFGDKRTTRWPDVPTAQELGYKVVSTSPYGLAGPKGMDPAVVKTLHDAFKKALFDPASIEIMKQLNQEPAYRDSADYKAWAQATYVKEKSLIEYLGLMAKD